MRGYKRHINDIKEEVESVSFCKVLSTEYKNVDTELEFQCGCGKIFYKSYANFMKLDNKCCRECYKSNFISKYNYNYVKNFIENESNSGCKLISDKYVNVDDKLLIECRCGNKFKTRFIRFLKGKRFCNKCGRKAKFESQKYTYEEVKRFIEVESQSGCELLSDIYISSTDKLIIQCKCGVIFETTFYNFKSGKKRECCECKKVSGYRRGVSRSRITKEKIIDFLSKYNFELVELAEELKDGDSRFIIRCSKGHEYETCYRSMYVGKCSCRICSYDKFKGSNNPSWKGGLTPLYEHLRCILEQWKKDSMQNCNYKCVITGDEFDVIHHLYGFNLILEETINNLNYLIYQNIGDYTEEELKNIEQECLDLHYKYGLGVCLRKDIHIEFHQLYGKMNNTPEQFEEFKRMKLKELSLAS